MGAESADVGAAAGLAAVLGLESPWRVERVQVDADRRRLAVGVGFERGGRFVCPKCGGAGAAAHDTAPAAWELAGEAGGWRVEVLARVPRVRCSACGRVRRVAVAWEKISRRLRGCQI